MYDSNILLKLYNVKALKQCNIFLHFFQSIFDHLVFLNNI